MLAPPREQAGLFVPLSLHDLAGLAKQEELCIFYLDALSYMHDLVAPYWDHPDHARFSVSDAVIYLKRIEQTHFEGKDSLARHVQDNTESAVYIGQQGAVIFNQGAPKEVQELHRDATSFMKGLLFTYNQVRAI